MDQLDISKFNPGDPTDDRNNRDYVEMMRHWMEDQGDEYAEKYAEYREQQAQQPTGESTWWYEAKRRGKQQLLEATKQSNRRFTPWGAAFNLREILPDGSLADNYLGAAEDAIAAAQLQGPLNIVNGLTDMLVEGINMELYVRNLPHSVIAGVVNEMAGEAILPTEAPQLPVYDYSLDAFVHEDPALHGWSKFLGATGVTMLLPGGIAKHAGTALKGTSVGRMFTGISKANNRLVETVVGQAKHLLPKSLGKAVLPRATARAKQVAGKIKAVPASVAPKGAIDFADLSTTGDSLYGAARLEKLGKYLDRRGFKLRIDDARLPADKGAGFIAGSKEILVRTNATKSQVWHELAHYLDYKRLGRPAYMNVPYPLGREQAAYNFLRNSRHWEQMSLWDRALLESRILNLGGTIIE